MHNLGDNLNNNDVITTVSSLSSPYFNNLSSTNFIFEDTKYCPICKYDISKFIEGLLMGERSRKKYNVFSSDIVYSNIDTLFTCPYCRSEFLIK